MCKFNGPFGFYSRQCPAYGVEQGICRHIVSGTESFAFEYPPQHLGDVQMRRGRERKNKNNPLSFSDSGEARLSSCYEALWHCQEL